MNDPSTADQRLAQSHVPLENLARLVPGVIYQYRLYPDGRSAFPYSSPGMNDIYEVTPEEVREDATPVFRRLHPDDYDIVASAIGESARTLQTFYSEFRVVLPRQGLRWRWSQAHPERTEDGGTLWHGIIMDVTERKRVDEALQVSNQRYRNLFDQANEGLVVMTTQGQIAEVNQAFAEMHGYSVEELSGKDIQHLDALRERTLEERAAIIHRLESGEVVRFDVEHIHKDGHSFPLSVTTSQINLGGQSLWLAFHQDITARRQAEAERATLETQLQQARKMESVGRLAGGVAHDFNNMLGVILGHTELALEQVSPGQPLHVNLSKICQAATRSADLTRQLLAFSRQQTITPKALDLNEMVQGMLTLLRPLIGEDIDLKWHPAADLWPVRMDPSQIDQLLTNLLVNARDALSDVGKVTLETGNTTFDEGYCAEHAGSVPGEYVRLDVSDDGCGMDKDTLSHVFEPFFTTKQLGKGTGLGLSTAYGIVKQNNGFISVYSEPGEGSKFSIYLPRHAGEAQPAGTSSPATAPRGQETILLVEDEPAILELAATILERQGYTVLAAPTPGDAIQLGSRHPGPIHLLLTDMIMPGMNGRDLAKNLLAGNPHLKSLFMSGYTAGAIGHHGVLDADVSFIQKPFSINDLAAKVRETLDRE